MEKNLDSYLENLGISDDAESKAPVMPSSVASPLQDAPPLEVEATQGSSDTNAGNASAITEDFLSGLLEHQKARTGFLVRAANSRQTAQRGLMIKRRSMPSPTLSVITNASSRSAM